MEQQCKNFVCKQEFCKEQRKKEVLQEFNYSSILAKSERLQHIKLRIMTFIRRVEYVDTMIDRSQLIKFWKTKAES